ncbi:MAG: LemA protein [Patescibacteria group bacterium]|nr:LemA protein [Patescibacteria group bacterium]
MEEKNFLQRNKGWIIALVLVVAVVAWGVSKYNSFVVMGEKVDGQWAQVESQYQRRFDLIPNLEASVKGVTKQEENIFLGIAEARSKYSGAVTTEDKVKATAQVESALGRLLAIVENYPALQSSQAFRDLMVSLEGTENRIAVERMNYNNMVRDFNATVKRFPNSVFASVFGVDARTYFEIAEGVEDAPKVDFVN